jgi:hypothetical protein
MSKEDNSSTEVNSLVNSSVEATLSKEASSLAQVNNKKRRLGGISLELDSDVEEILSIDTPSKIIQENSSTTSTNFVSDISKMIKSKKVDIKHFYIDTIYEYEMIDEKKSLLKIINNDKTYCKMLNNKRHNGIVKILKCFTTKNEESYRSIVFDLNMCYYYHMYIDGEEYIINDNVLFNGILELKGSVIFVDGLLHGSYILKNNDTITFNKGIFIEYKNN